MATGLGASAVLGVECNNPGLKEQSEALGSTQGMILGVCDSRG